MGLFDFLRKKAAPTPSLAPAASAETLEIPLFPLQSVFFPGGTQTLKVFEQRYLDMAAACLKDSRPFGICLIAEGSETGPAATPHPVGTLAEVVSAEVPQLGIMMLAVRGTRRFRIIDRQVASDQLQLARVELLPETDTPAFPPERQRLLPLLQRILSDLGTSRIPPPHRIDSAAWVGYRLVEVLPVQALAKQKLLELDDPEMRLVILERYLDQRNLLD